MDCMGKQFIDGWGRTLRAESEALVSYFTEEALYLNHAKSHEPFPSSK